MSDVAMTLRQTGYRLLSLSRNPRVLVFTLAFPVLLLVLFNAIFDKESNRLTPFEGEQVVTATYFTGGMIAYAIMMATFSTLAIALTTQRETGMLKRYRGTPVPAWTFIAAQVASSIVMSVAMVVVLLAVAALGFDVGVAADRIPALAVYVLLGTAALSALGIALTAVTTTAESAATIAPFAGVILSFISGVFIPVDQLPGFLVDIGRIFPLAHLAEGLQRTLILPTGTGFDALNLAVLGAWGIAGAAVAARGFRWEPKAAAG
jgi:ABC-2 type transport system permease protein